MAAGTEEAIRVRGLVKRYGDLVAVGGIDLSVPRGTCLGLLGPNGAGKTTTIEILEGLTRADEGEVEVLGLRWDRASNTIRERIGVQLQETELQDKLTVFETARLFRSFYAEGRDVAEVLEDVGLTEKRDARVVNLSGGQKQRLTLACALVNRPAVLFLDEPTTGLDPQARRHVWEIVEEFTAAGGTVLLTTHYMEEAERLADEVVIVDRGQVIAEGSPADVIADLDAESIVELVFNEEDQAAALSDGELCALAGIESVRREGALLALSVTDTQSGVGALLGVLTERGVELESLRTHRPTLEDVFVTLTGKHLRDD